MLCLSILLLLAFLVSPALALGYYRVNILVAYDEEWQWIAQYIYAYSPETLAYVIMLEACPRFSQFDIRFYITSYVSWDSNDNPANEDVMMNESISETNFETGMEIGYYEIDVLIAFTGQDIPNVLGYSDSALGVVLVEHAYPDGVGQATDNILQHELSHLYGALEDNVEGLNCVMNRHLCYIGFPWGWVPTALTTTNWCSNCVETINSNRTLWGYYCTSGGGGANPRWLKCAW